MEPEYLLSITQNPITPVEILERLTKIEKVKYANKIRCCAKDNLQSRNKNICIEKKNLEGYDIIRLKSINKVFVSEKFKNIFQSNNFTGYSFREVELV